MASRRVEDALQVLRSQYAETPGLSLTPADVARFLALDRPTAGVLLRALEHSRFLERLPDGRFTLASHSDETAES